MATMHRRAASPCSWSKEITPSATRMCAKPISFRYSNLTPSGMLACALATLNTVPTMSIVAYPAVAEWEQGEDGRGR